MSDEENQYTLATGAGETPGAMLRAARERKGLSVQDVANGLNLKSHVVEAIEDDRYERLPPRTFVKGYLKSYANLVGLSESVVLAALERHLPEEAPVALHTVAPRQVDRGVDLSGWLKWLLLLILLGAALFWADSRFGLLDGGSAVLSPQPAQEPAAPPMQGGDPAPLPLSEQPASSAVTPPLEEQAPQESAAESEAEPEPEPAPAEVTAAATESAAEPAPAPAEAPADELVIEVRGESWIDVRAANGARRFVGLARGPRTLQLKGPAPFKVVVGNPSQVEVRYGGQAIPLEAAAGEPARLTIPAG